MALSIGSPSVQTYPTACRTRRSPSETIQVSGSKVRSLLVRQSNKKGMAHKSSPKFINYPTGNLSGRSSISGSNGVSRPRFDCSDERLHNSSTIQRGNHLRRPFQWIVLCIHTKGSTVEETVEGKRAFERYSKNHGIRIKHYHADIGIFEAKGFRDALAIDGQTISYCGVNAHHQNGRAEKKIRDLQELARTMLLHAQHRWPEAINAHLWPYALKIANDNCNRTPAINNDGISPIELFSQVSIAPQIKHAHTFGSPVYVLNSALQIQGKGVPKWDQRANVGIYLGISPRHSRKVALVLNLKNRPCIATISCGIRRFL